MKGRVPYKEQPLPGVKCTVNSCYYNSPGNYCNAAKIEIQSPGAANTEETDCATFVMK